MSWNAGIRQVHRWTSVIFTVAVIFVTAVVNTSEQEPAEWVYLLPLAPLAVLFLTGAYMYVLPYISRRGGRTRDR